MASRSQIARRRKWMEQRGDAAAPSLPSEKPIEKMTVAELTDYAVKNGIDLGDAKKKDELLAVIAAAQEPPGDE